MFLKNHHCGASQPFWGVGYEKITQFQGLMQMLTLQRNERKILLWTSTLSLKWPLLQSSISAWRHRKRIFVIGKKEVWWLLLPLLSPPLCWASAFIQQKSVFFILIQSWFLLLFQMSDLFWLRQSLLCPSVPYPAPWTSISLINTMKKMSRVISASQHGESPGLLFVICFSHWNVTSREAETFIFSFTAVSTYNSVWHIETMLITAGIFNFMLRDTLCSPPLQNYSTWASRVLSRGRPKATWSHILPWRLGKCFDRFSWLTISLG